MKAAVISVGTELLFGQITNTDSVYLSRELQTLGIDLLYHHTVGDNAGRFRTVLERAFEDCDLVVTTGGLGPTQDDLTKEVVAETLNDTLVLHEPSMTRIEDFFRHIGREMTDNNRKQAYLPSRAVVFENGQGTAPGFALEHAGRTAICLPGPPRELTAMFESGARPFLESRGDGVIRYRILRTFGIGESSLETALEDLIDAQTDPTLATYAKDGECSLRIASKRATAREAEDAVESMRRRVHERVGRYVYSDDDEDAAQVVGKRLIEAGIRFSCAESCTGGLFAARMTDVPGISAVFDRGFVTYSDAAKTDELGVPAETIRAHGAVSEETARAMARGLTNVTKSRLNIAVTGIAGPDGGTADKPVGLAFVACVLDGEETCESYRVRNLGRAYNRNIVVLNMLALILRLTKPSA